jgi:hypothetical protein
MQKWFIILTVAGMAALLPVQQVHAQIPVLDIIKAGITKVIKAIDLEVQRLQNQTVGLQSAQKVVENTMSELHLNEITGWVQQQKDLYSEYYNELWQVKTIITDYHRIKEIYQKQTQLVAEYNQAWHLLQQDKHFTAGEISYMGQVYSGILDATVQNINQLLVVVNALTTQMSDAQRMAFINQVGHQVDKNYDDLHRFNTQNSLVSLSRTKDENDAAMVRWMYGLQ